MTDTKKYEIRQSSIHGNGVFATKDLKENERYGLAIHFYFGVWPIITSYVGAWINHCGPDKVNTLLVWDDSDEAYDKGRIGWYFQTSKAVKKGEELLMDYSNTPFYIQGPLDYYTC